MVDEFETSTGKRVRVGQVYRDKRRAKPRPGGLRTLLVQSLETPWEDWDNRKHCLATCRVLERDGHPVEANAPRATTGIEAENLAGPEFELIENFSPEPEPAPAA